MKYCYLFALFLSSFLVGNCFQVSIVANPLLPSNRYSRNTSLTLSCEVQGVYYGSLSYNWTSTSAYNPPRSFIAGRTSSIVTTTSLHSYDYEDHTCTAYDESGRNGSAVFRISLSGGSNAVLSIVAEYTPPHSSSLRPPSYYSNTALSFFCKTFGLTLNGLHYEWTSTCSGDCFSKGATTSLVSTTYLQFKDSGVHTCTVTDRNGRKYSTSINISVIEPAVSVRVHYTPPDQYSYYSPPNYRVTSELRLTCETSNIVPGPYKICWTYPCPTCYKTLYRQEMAEHCHSDHTPISISWLNASHTGIYTCNLTDSLGRTGNNSIQINVVGSGIYLSTFIDGHSYGSNPNNTYAVVNTGRSYNTTRLLFYCCSNYYYYNYGYYYEYHSRTSLRTPSGNIIGHFYQDNIISDTSSIHGCFHVYINQRRHSSYDLESGIYTCRVPESGGRIQELMIGLYPVSFESYPYVYNIYTIPSDQVLTIICQTRDAPPTNLYWYWNDTLINIDGDIFTVSQRVTNYTSSSYDNMLLVDYKQGNAVGTYHCNVSNHYGTSNSSVISIKDFSIFQLKLRPIDANLLNSDDLERSIQDRLVKEINRRCKCGFRSSNIISGEFRQQISTHSIIYRAKVHITNGTHATVDQVMGYIQEWRKDQGTLLLHFFRLTVANEMECPLRIMSFDGTECV